MALEEYVGDIILEVDGKEVDVKSVEETIATNRSAVKTMNRTKRPKGYRNGMVDYSLQITAPVPKEGELVWENVVDAKITIEPTEEGGKRISYLDCAVTEVGGSYDVDNEATRNISMIALRKVKE